MMSPWKVVKTVLSAMLGVRPAKGAEDDFSQQKVWPFIWVGIAFVVLFVAVLLMVVKMVLPPELNDTVHVEEHALSRNGYKLHLTSYEYSGNMLPTDYRDVLLVHGLTYSSMQFDLNIRDYSLARYLAHQGFRVWLLDITGYGQSDKPQDGFSVNTHYATKDINAAVDYILKTEKTNKINLVGWSWGTITASQFVSAHPDKINKLVLIAPIINGLNLPAPEIDYQVFSVESAKSDFNLQKTEPDVLDAYLLQTEHYDGAGSPNGGRRDLFQPKHVQLIPYQDLNVPTLFIAGDADPYLSARQDLAILMEYAPVGSCEVNMNGAGHALFLEKEYYRDFQKNISRFFREGCAGLQ